jgi:hypothetical protein
MVGPPSHGPKDRGGLLLNTAIVAIARRLPTSPLHHLKSHTAIEAVCV